MGNHDDFGIYLLKADQSVYIFSVLGGGRLAGFGNKRTKIRRRSKNLHANFIVQMATGNRLMLENFKTKSDNH